MVTAGMFADLVPDEPPEATHVMRTWRVMGGQLRWSEALIAAELADPDGRGDGELLIEGLMAVSDEVAKHRAKAMEAKT